MNDPPRSSLLPSLVNSYDLPVRRTSTPSCEYIKADRSRQKECSTQAGIREVLYSFVLDRCTFMHSHDGVLVLLTGRS